MLCGGVQHQVQQYRSAPLLLLLVQAKVKCETMMRLFVAMYDDRETRVRTEATHKQTRNTNRRALAALLLLRLPASASRYPKRV